MHLLLLAVLTSNYRLTMFLVYPPDHTFTTERPMKIEIVVDPSKPPPPASLASRVAPPPKAQATTAATTPATTRSVTLRMHDPCSHIQMPRATRVGRGRGRGKPRNQRLPKTAADLDAEMEVRVLYCYDADSSIKSPSGLHRDQHYGCRCSSRCLSE